MKRKITIILLSALTGLNAYGQTIKGVDVSSYEGTINWAQVKAGGYTFAFAKATEGIALTDSYYVGNQVNGNAAGMVMGSYHFARPENNSATAEANYFLSVAGPYIKACHLPPVLDVEDPPGGPGLSTYFTSAQLTSWIQTWMSTVQNATGVAPIIYIGPSNASFVNSSLNTYGLWIDDYNSNPNNPPPNIGVWTKWEFKQFTWTATVPGISGTANVDADVFNGTLSAFKTAIGCNPVTADFTSDAKSVCPGSTVKFTDKSTSTGTISGWSWTFAGGNPATSSAQNPSVVYSTPGTYSVKELITSSAGKDSVTYLTYIHVASSGSLPLAQDFQGASFPPAGWFMNIPNPYDSLWQLCTSRGYNSTQCMYFPANCGNTGNITGQRQQLYTPDYSFTGVWNAELSFDVAYEPSKLPTYSDTLCVYYSTDCGTTWKNIYSRGGATLSTTGSTTGAGTDTAGSHGHGCFIPPNTSAWRRDSVSLSALNGMSNVMFSFENRSGWGNILYLDNINIVTGPLSVPNLKSNDLVKVYPNPNRGSFIISYQGFASEKARVVIYDLLGQELESRQIDSDRMEMNLQVKPGMYFYRVLAEQSGVLISRGNLVIQN
jgi:GH25 family lysozyme M1 (1,4-beta-N-acetylmuramidase)